MCDGTQWKRVVHPVETEELKPKVIVLHMEWYPPIGANVLRNVHIGKTVTPNVEVIDRGPTGSFDQGIELSAVNALRDAI